MTREYKLTHQAAQWDTFESWIKDKECLRMYIRAEVINGSPDITEVYRRGPFTIFQYGYELQTFCNRMALAFARSDYDKNIAEFELFA